MMPTSQQRVPVGWEDAPNLPFPPMKSHAKTAAAHPVVGIRKQLLKEGERDAKVSQRAILEAATEAFSARGLEGARVDEIAQAAGINKQLLYRYFGSKDDLYLRVLEDVYERFRETEKDLGLTEMEPAGAIRLFIASVVERLHDRPYFARLVIDENFHGGRHLKNSERVRRLHAELLTVIDQVLQRGVQTGVFREGIDSFQLFTSITCLASFYVTNMHTLSAIFGARFEQVNDVATVASHTEQMVFGFIAADPTAHRDAQRQIKS